MHYPRSQKMKGVIISTTGDREHNIRKAKRSLNSRTFLYFFYESQASRIGEGEGVEGEDGESVRSKSSLTCKRTGTVRLVKRSKQKPESSASATLQRFSCSRDSAGDEVDFRWYSGIIPQNRRKSTSSPSHTHPQTDDEGRNCARIVLPVYFDRGVATSHGRWRLPSTFHLPEIDAPESFYYRKTRFDKRIQEARDHDPRDRVGWDGLGFFVRCATPPALGF
jgi:hypothetical protein